MVSQVGGNHYEATYQHWDWVADCNIGYLEGNCSKYVCRYFKKNGAQDLDKAESYVVKMIELFSENRYKNQSKFVDGYFDLCDESLEKFATSSQLTVHQTSVCISLMTWRSLDDLCTTQKQIQLLRKRLIGMKAPFGYPGDG